MDPERTPDELAILELAGIRDRFHYREALEMCGRCGRRTDRALRNLARERLVRRVKPGKMRNSEWEAGSGRDVG